MMHDRTYMYKRLMLQFHNGCRKKRSGLYPNIVSTRLLNNPIGANRNAEITQNGNGSITSYKKGFVTPISLPLKTQAWV